MLYFECRCLGKRAPTFNLLLDGGISTSLLSMVRSHNLSIVSTARALRFFIISSTRVVTVFIDDKQGKAWLIDYRDYMLLGHVSQDLISRDAPIVSAHLINSSNFYTSRLTF